MLTQPLNQRLLIETPRGQQVTCNKTIMGCPILIKDRVMLVRLLVFKDHGYDIILGIDWLTKYHASIDCRKNEVVFCLPGIEPFKFKGSHVRATPPPLLAIQVKKSIQQGAQAFLAYVTAKPEVERRLEDILIACEYPDVFTKSALGIPPNHEIKFSINLILGTQPVYKAPYRMAPTKLKELKEQLISVKCYTFKPLIHIC
jgi:hypothetical protein